jgi:hypothetical protein
VTSRRTVIAVTAALAFFTAVAGSAAAGGGNSSNAKLCQKSGWQTVETDAGGHFADAEACTSYAASGGTLFHPTLTPVFDGCLGVAFNGQVTYYAIYAFDLSGFHPNSAVTFRPPGSPYPFPGFTVTTDTEGSASTAPSTFVYSPGEAAGLEATDADGVDASVQFTAAGC